jgi:superfamily I DNA and/or RNA helicase
MAADSKTALRTLAELWRQERLATRAQAEQLRDAIPFSKRVARGLALTGLRFENVEATGAGRCQLWFVLERPGALERASINVGDLVVLWSGNHRRTQSGVVGRRGQSRLSVFVDSDYDPFVEQGAIQLDVSASEVTFDRGDAAIEAFVESEELFEARELLFGDAIPSFSENTPVECLDERLDESQRQAVELALRATQFALIHGPPGTGKTRTLVEVIRQHFVEGRSVLVTAASNTAVDHLTRQLVQAGVKPLRLGHPARVAEDLRPLTAEALTENTAEYRMARRWQNEARALRQQHDKAQTRGRSGRGRRPGGAALAQANQLNADARRQLKAARRRVLQRARVVCSTAAGADSSALGGLSYDVVVLDEATQAPDPIALAALQRGRVAVLAGDPCQLSPTIVDPAAARAGLSTTLFERASKRWPTSATHLLEIQYRMHERLMRFPSESMYDGRLRADPNVAKRLLEDLEGVSPDSRRRSPWVFVDTTGAGWSEQIEEESLSTFNTEQAKRTAFEVTRLLERGIAATQIAAITPYGAQVRLLRTLLADAVSKGLEVGTVDGFQGREKEAVVVDLVRSNTAGEFGFLADVRRTNVALTRAKRALIVVCDSSTLIGHDYYRALLEAAQRDGAWESCLAPKR